MNGVAKSQISYLTDEEKSITAHFIPSDQDLDGDGLMDWFELNQFGDLNQSSNDDADGDGYSNIQESQLGQQPTIADQVVDGGISFSASLAISYASDAMTSYVIKSDPAGLLQQIDGTKLSGEEIKSANLNGEKDGYHFAYWSLNGIRQSTDNGQALNQVTFPITQTSELIAHYIPSNRDEDGDGLMDWLELNQFGNLLQSGTDDPDQDGYINSYERELGQEVLISDLVEDGGISFATSTNAFYYIQAYDYLEGIEINNTRTLGIQDAGLAVGSFSALDSVWDPGRIHDFQFQLVSGKGAADNHRFKINNGVLTTNESLVPGTYSIRVRAVNFLKIFTEESFIITAETPPPPPNRAPSFIHEPDGKVLKFT